MYAWTLEHISAPSISLQTTQSNVLRLSLEKTTSINLVVQFPLSLDGIEGVLTDQRMRWLLSSIFDFKY